MHEFLELQMGTFDLQFLLFYLEVCCSTRVHSLTVALSSQWTVY